MDFTNQKSPFKFGEITADALLEVTHQRVAKSTRHPLEDGSSITDNRNKEPIEIPVKVFATDTPGQGDRPGRAGEVFQQLEQAWSKGTEQNLVVGLMVYQNAVLDELKTTETATLGSHALTIECKFIQIRKAKTKTIKLQSTGRRNQGRKTPSSTDQAKTSEAPVKSAAKKLAEAAGILKGK